MRMIRIFLVLTLAVTLSACQYMQTNDSDGYRPDSRPLFTKDSGRTFQVSSHSPNGPDAAFVQPGETITLLEMEGPAVIQNIWTTLGNLEEAGLRHTTLRFYWDGEENPSVEAPWGDFFGSGFGEYTPWQSERIGVTSGGVYCYFPMPFHKSAKITFTNDSAVAFPVFWHFLGQKYESLPEETLYFHAQWRRENPTTMGENYTFASLEGEGYFAGVVQQFQGFDKAEKINFFEGDEWFYIDGEENASVIGTGTEDYYQGGWYFRDGVFNALWHGLSRRDHEKMRFTCYRFHLNDPIQFETSLLAQIEHGQRTYNEANVDYSSVAYWYQTEPHKPFEPLPERAPSIVAETPNIFPGALEFEGTPGSGPNYATTYTKEWSNFMAALFGFPEAGGATTPVKLNIEQVGTYAIGVNYIVQDHGGILQVLIDGQPVGEPYDTYSDDPKDDYLLNRNRASGIVDLGTLELSAGEHDVQIQVVGKNEKSKGYFAFVDCVTVLPVEK